MSGALHTLVGDVVASRQLPDRAEGQHRLNQVLAEVTAWLRPVQPLEPTVGDEFQGAFATLGEATLAALLVRLGTLPEVDVRCGLGYGDVVVHDSTRRPLLQDGPGWWAAREALEDLGPKRRTLFVGPGAGRVNAYLTTRDALVERLSERGWRMLDMALRGRTQQEIAESERISRPAVSQQFARGITAVRDAHALFVSEE